MSACSEMTGGGLRPLLPELRLLQDLTDDILFLNDGYDPHRAGALRADQRVEFVDLLYQPDPGAAGGPGLGGVVLYRRRFRRLLFKAQLPSLPPLDAGIPAVLADEVLSSVGDVGRDGGQEVE
jgi:hypothetical protein